MTSRVVVAYGEGRCHGEPARFLPEIAVIVTSGFRWFYDRVLHVIAESWRKIQQKISAFGKLSALLWGRDHITCNPSNSVVNATVIIMSICLAGVVIAILWYLAPFEKVWYRGLPPSG